MAAYQCQTCKTPVQHDKPCRNCGDCAREAIKHKCQADDCVDSGGEEINCPNNAYFRITTNYTGTHTWVLCEEHLTPAITTVIGAGDTVTVSLLASMESIKQP